MMRKTILGSMTSLLLPLAAYGAPSNYGAYQRKLTASAVSHSVLPVGSPSSWQLQLPAIVEADELFLTQGTQVRELVLVDANVQDKHLILKQAKPGIDIIEIQNAGDGVEALVQALTGYKNLQAVHIVAHAEAGVMYLGGHQIDKQTLLENIPGFTAINQAVREGGDLLLYGCDLAHGKAGEDFLEVLQKNTHVDIAASSDKTGNETFGGNWKLEIQKGNIETNLLADSIALKDFSEVLAAPAGIKNFSSGWTDTGNTLVSTDFIVGAKDANSTTPLDVAIYAAPPNPAYIQNGESVNSYFYVNADGVDTGTFELTGLTSGEYLTGQFTDVYIVGILPDNSTIISSTINGSGATSYESFNFGTSELSNFSGVQLKGFKLYFDANVLGSVPFFEFRSFTTGTAQDPDTTPPVFQNGTPSVSGTAFTQTTLTVRLDEIGTAFYVVVADGAGAPSSAQVVAGQNSSGTAALFSGSINATTAAQDFTTNITGLTMGTAYDLYVVARDDEGSPNLQASPTLVDFSTPAFDSDAVLTAAGFVSEPVDLASTIDTAGEAVDVFDFTITDGGASDGLATTVAQIFVNVSGTSTDAERSQITWRLNGPDASNVMGTYDAGADTITFSGLGISIANGGNETYTINAYFNDNTGLTDGSSVVLSIDGDADITVGGSGTQMASGQAAVTNGTGTSIDVTATQLVFTTLPSGSVSGVALTTQPVIAATDDFGNTDVGFTETITLTEASAGGLVNNTQVATAGVATFTNLIYTATTDQQAFTLTANDQDGIGSNLPTVDASPVISDVVATQLIFTTQPSPISVDNGITTSFTTVPVVTAVDANSITDTGYATAFVLAEVNGAGSAILTGAGDEDASATTVTLSPSSGVATFTGMQLTYTAAGSSNETFNLRASSAGLTVADSSSFTATVPPSVTSVDVPVSGTYKTGDTLTFTVNTSENVTVSGTPRIAITVGSDTVYAEYFGGSGTSDLVFTYTITAGDLDSNGIALASVIEANGGTLQDGDANDLILTLNAVGSTAAVLVDAVAPTISSVSVPAADTYLVGETLSFTVNTTENVTVSTGGGTPHLPLTIGATAREAVYVSGSTTSALVFSYTVQAGDNDGDGIAIGASAVLDGGTMRDAAGNDLTLTLNTVGDTSGVLVDTAAPTLQTLSPADDSATVAANANFVMTFSEDITLGAGDITFYDSLNVQVAVIDVASHGGQLSITGNELTINPTADLSESTSYYIHVDNGAVTDLAGIAYAGIADSTSWNFTVADVTPPTVTSITVAGSPSASAEAIQFTVTFDEVPANISVSDFTLTPSGAGVSGNIASNSPVNLNTVTVTVDQITGTGTLRLDVNASSGITDTLGNGNGTNGFVPAFTSGDLHTVDREAPGVPTGLSLDAASDSGTPGDAITNDNTPTINGTADANVTVEVSSDVDGVLGTTTSDGSGAWSFTPGAAMTDGAHNLTATAADTAGNESAASSALAIEVDTAAPTAGIDMADTTLVAGEASSVTITFSEAILGFTNDDLTLANGTLTNVSSSDGNVTWTATFTPAADTTSAVNLISLDLTGVTDAAGNAGAGTENSANYTIDTLRPSATVVIADTELLAGETSLVTMTFNEAVSGFSTTDLTVVNGSLDAVASSDGGVTWTATFTPDPDIYELDNIISLDNTGVVDAAGNTGSGTTFSNEFTVRTQALTLLVTSDLDTGDDETTAVTLVDDEADGNGLSLREALFWARSNGDTITFDLDGGTAGNQGGTITLNGSELAVNHNNLIIDGDLDDDGTPDITLSGNNVSRIMRVASGRTGIELVGLTLTQGAGNGGGGGLALEINTDTTLRDSMITDNHELGWGGGGIYGSTATLRIINSTISGNSSDSFGGGIRLVGNGVLHLINSTVSDNTTTGAGAHGAGIQYAGPDLLIVNSTISGNAAMGSGAIGGGLRISGGTSTVYNSTIVGNAAADSAGGVSANGTNDVFVNTVVAGNAAGAGAMAGASGSPLATGGSASDAIGTIEVATNSYFGTSATITTDNNGLNNQGTLDLLLGDLADNGGSVMTHRPMAGSALSDAGSNADLPADTYDLDSDTNVAEALPVDALGASRVSGAAVDIGAVEGNRAPVLLDLDGGNTHVEDGVAVVIDNDVTVTDDELDGLNGGNGNYNGASVTMARNGGADASDTFGFVDGSGISLVAGELIKNGQVIATFDTATAGQLMVTYTDANGELPERSDVNAVMQQITYATASNDPDTTVVLDWTFTDEAGASVTETASVTISLKNDAPVVTATGGTPTFTEGGTAVDLFSAASINPVEAAQSIISLQLTVTGANNGSDEILAIDGSDVLLTQGNALVTATNALDVSVAVAGTTATVTLSHATGITGAAAQAVIDGLTYRNTSENPNPLSRVVTLSSVQDNGGVANSGADTAAPAIAATVTLSAVNNAPTITGTPATVTDQNAPYSFTPSAADVDSDTLTFSIANQPAWASFDDATGTLSGVPSQANVGVVSNIVITVSDGSESASLPAFSLTVVDVNDAPVISGMPATSLDQDTPYLFTPTASDLDGDDLTFSMANQPAWASFDPATGTLAGTPDVDDVGVYPNIIITVSDGALTADLPSFSIEVLATNVAPEISGTPPLTAYVGAAYSFTPTASDADDDELTFSALGLPSWLTLDTMTGQLSGTPGAADADMAYNIALSVSDGIETVTLPVFTLTVEYDGAEPVVTPPEDITINAIGLYTPISLRQLLSLPPGTSAAAVQDALRGLASDSTGGEDCCVTQPQGLLANLILLPPGRHEIVWRATNPDGLTGEAVQVVNVRPRVAFGKHQVAVENTSVQVRVILNGRSPFYPLEVPYVIDPASTALLGIDHDAMDGSVTFTEGQTEVSFTVNLLAGGTPGDTRLIIRLDDDSPRSNEPIPNYDPANPDIRDINAGAADHHFINIIDGNVIPKVNLVMNQAGADTILVGAGSGPVTATAVVTDPNPGDTHSFNWAGTDSRLSDTDGNATNNTFVFDPAGQAGLRKLEVVTTDSAGGVDTSHLYFLIVPSLPTLDAGTDTDEDGVDDLTEGTSDTNSNGIPDYLDNMPSSNVLPQVIISTTSYLIECDPGVLCGIGQFALGGDSGGVQILNDELGVTEGLVADEDFEPAGGIFDFVIRDLPTAGQSVRIVIPQQAPIPANAVYRKFMGGEWVNFVENADNTLHSAPGNPGYCPPPGDDTWAPGLVEGYLCVQLSIQDGGPNDADGIVNSAIADPGAVSSAKPVEPPPPPPPPPATSIDSEGKGGGALDWTWLLFGGVLLVLRRYGSKKPAVLLLVVALFSGASQAQPEAGDTYLRLNVYQAEGDQSAGDFSSAMAGDGMAVSLRDYDESRVAYRLSVGYQWTEATSVELGYLDLGDVTVNFDTTVTDMAALTRALEEHYPMSADGFTLSHRFGHHFASGLSLSGEVGIFMWDGKIDVDGAAIDPDLGSGIDPLLGVQLDYRLAEPVSLGLGYQRIFFDGQSVDLMGVSGIWHF
jgi:large repetitive protein